MDIRPEKIDASIQSQQKQIGVSQDFELKNDEKALTRIKEDKKHLFGGKSFEVTSAVYKNPLLHQSENVPDSLDELEGRQDLKPNLLRDFTNLILAVPVVTTIHEGSHYLWAKSCDDVTEASINVVPGRDENGNFYMGYTSYKGEMDPGERATFSMAGVAGTKLAYETIYNLLKEGKLPEKQRSFYATLALLCGTDFPRYVATDYLKGGYVPGRDIQDFSKNSGISMGTMATLGISDMIFNWDKLRYLYNVARGKNPEAPKESDFSTFLHYDNWTRQGVIGIEFRF